MSSTLDNRLTPLVEISRGIRANEAEHDELVRSRNDIIASLTADSGITLDRIAIAAGISQTRVVQIRKRLLSQKS